MDILNFEKQYIKEATALALANYYDERQFVKELPQVCDIPDLNGFAGNGLGVAAFEDEKMIGFLCCHVSGGGRKVGKSWGSFTCNLSLCT